MNRAIAAILLLLNISFIAVADEAVPPAFSKILKIIDRESGETDKFAMPIYVKADSIQAVISKLPEGHSRLESQLRLAKLLQKVESDSAQLVYRNGLEEAYRLGDKDMIEKYLIASAYHLCLMGLSIESIELLNRLDSLNISEANRADYYRTGLAIVNYMYENYPRSAQRSTFLKRAIEYAENIIEYNPEAPYVNNHKNAARTFLAGQTGNSAEYVALLNDALARTNILDPEYSTAARLLGQYHSNLGNHQEAARIFALGALSDIRLSNLHGSSQILLAKELYSLGDISRAYQYLTDALERSLRVDSRLNQMEISMALKPVDDDMRSVEHRRIILLSIMAVILVIALAALLRAALSYRRETRELRQLKQKLSDANTTKETYISQYLNLSSTFLERLEGFAKTCGRKITAGQFDDLLSYVKSGKVVEAQRKEFYDIFDDTFTHIYPTFVEDVNALMHPDKRIVVAANTLTTELRILAFQRLGIEDATKVARFLGLSLNTIYTYRNKIRSRAINRETFDADVMNIGIIS